ncbi:hypothetical protein PV330_22925 [Streptomyces caniscabiei]|uniref:hypothetical protein n=2 Tax=Streptomyces caniscabiei TaxID=2746961 RepID=UPI0029A770F1|nr:hypothetical protein [Streptomyces caniscabiei]MDX2602847.1 hypothetical protein [Streptomyces caniscabiei]MDX2737866.1 hypothetical protein [Streptomyces caniscabiei]
MAWRGLAGRGNPFAVTAVLPFMELDPDRCLTVPEGFDDSDAESQVHPMARKLFLATTAADAFRKAHEWVGAHDVFLVDVSWAHAHDEPEPYVLAIYFTFEEPQDQSDQP